MSRLPHHNDRERPVGSDALSKQERAVLDLTDANIGIREIARRTGTKVHRVVMIQRNYAVSARDDWKNDARIGSMTLTEAIDRMLSRRRAIGAGK